MADNLPASSGFELFAEGSEYDTELKRKISKLSQAQLIRRRLFVSHFIKTGNKAAAARFAGFTHPDQQANRLSKDPVVKAMIAEKLETLDREAIVSRNEIMFGLKKEATDFENGSSSSRVAAWTQLAKINSMLVERYEKTEITKGGVMMVPGGQSLEEWEQNAADQQRKLKDEVRD